MSCLQMDLLRKEFPSSFVTCFLEQIVLDLRPKIKCFLIVVTQPTIFRMSWSRNSF